jgi:drug/metabolite transporter (DMT)-like permease
MGYIKIIIAILIWSSLGIIVRKIDMPLMGKVFYPAAISGLLNLTLLSLTGQAKKSFRIPHATHKMLIFIAVPVCTIANTSLFFYAFTHTTIANAVLSHYTAPIFVALMAPFFLKERSYKTTWISILLSSLGLWLMLWMPSVGGTISLSGSERQGIIAGACSGLAYAFLILMMRALASHHLSIFITLIQNSMVAFILMPFVIGMPFTSQSLPYLVALGIFHSTVAPVLYVQGFKSVKANDAAILGYLEPVGASVLAFVFLREVPAITALFGGALILVSGYLVLRNR